MTLAAPASLDLADTSLELIRAGQAPSGAIIASPSFSPYRYAWFRDGAFMAEALDLAGDTSASARFHAWAARVVLASTDGMERAVRVAAAGTMPARDDVLHCRYTVDGRPATGGGRGGEDWPTFQLDGPGIWLWSMAHHIRRGGSLTPELQAAVPLVSRYLAALWQTPCFDAWEESGDRVHTSTVAAIAAGLAAAVELDPGLRGDAAIDQARAEIDGWLADGDGPYTKWRGTDVPDGALLWMAAPYELVAPDDVRFAATLEAIERTLMPDGVGVHRYAADTFYGGGAWPVLTSAYGRVMLRRDAPGDRARARAALAWIEETADAEGALPEQIADHALAPERIAEWQRAWGPAARPLLWSHAAYLALHAELADAATRPATREGDR